MKCKAKVQKEIFKTIKDYPNYKVSNFGNVKSMERKVRNKDGFRTVKERILKPGVGTRGYYYIILSENNKQKNRTVHQIVAEAFLNHKACMYKLVINHINHNKLDNRAENLEIVTQRTNTNQKHLISTSKYTGVNWDKKSSKWKASIHIKGENKYLGLFINELEASNTYQKALVKL